MIKAVSNPTIVTLDGIERSNTDCLKYIEEFDGYDSIPTNIQSLCGAITFKGPGYINVPKVWGSNSLLVFVIKL